MKETYVKLSDITYQNFVLGPGMLAEAATRATIEALPKYEVDSPEKKRVKKDAAKK